mgnify:CR=1 FL=1
MKLYLIPEKTREDKAKNEQKNFDILKYDGVRAQKMGKLVYAIKCFTEALNIQEDFETMSYLVSAYTMANDADGSSILVDESGNKYKVTFEVDQTTHKYVGMKVTDSNGKVVTDDFAWLDSYIKTTLS